MMSLEKNVKEIMVVFLLRISVVCANGTIGSHCFNL